MTFLCLEPVISAGKLSAFTTFTHEGQFMFHQISEHDNPNADHYFSGKFIHFCFSAPKILPTFGDRLTFLWDVKILYELLGHKFDDLIDLGKQILGSGRMDKYVALSQKTNAHIKSYKVTNINVSAYEVIQLLPEHLVHDLYIERAGIIMDLLAKLPKKDREFYKSFYSSVVMLEEIGREKLKIDLSAISDNDTHYADMVRRNTVDGEVQLKFNPVGAKTGRIGFEKGSFNLYTLPRDMRSCIVASPGHHFVEFDFKASQPRIAIACTGDSAFIDLVRDVEDIYSIFPGERDVIKIGFLAWMFGKTRVPNSVYEQYAWPIWELRDRVAKESSDAGFLETRFGRRLSNHEEDRHVIFQNYITATEVDFILGLTQKLHGLSGCNVKFPFHDAIVIETYGTEQIGILRRMCENYFQEQFGIKGPVGVKIGKNFGEMKPLSKA